MPMLRASALPFNVRSERGICILLDRTIQLGPAGCAKLLEKSWAKVGALPEAKRFEVLFDDVRAKFWSHRVRTLLESDQLSFDVVFDDIAAVTQAPR
jgi:hypothetical protein